MGASPYSHKQNTKNQIQLKITCKPQQNHNQSQQHLKNNKEDMFEVFECRFKLCKAYNLQTGLQRPYWVGWGDVTAKIHQEYQF